MIPAVPAIDLSQLASSSPAGNISPSAGIGPTTASATPTGSDGFSNVLGQAIDSLNGISQNADTLSLKGATGQANVADVTVAATQAQLDVELTTAVRDKAVAAFNAIMAMPA